MHFEHEISADEYAAAQILYHKLSSGRSRFRNAAYWIGLGSLSIAVAWMEKVSNLAPALLILIASLFFYFGIASLFPAKHFRRGYGGSRLAGKKFVTDMNEDGFEETGDLCSWRVQWPAVRLRGEDALVFMLSTGGSIFIFGKRYLSTKQQEEFRRLSGF